MEELHLYNDKTTKLQMNQEEEFKSKHGDYHQAENLMNSKHKHKK